MFIETSFQQSQRSRGAQSFRQSSAGPFRSAGARKTLFRTRFYKRISSLRDENPVIKILLKKQGVTPLLHGGLRSPRLTSQGSLPGANRVQLLVVAAEIDGAVTSDRGTGIGAVARDELPLVRAVGVNRVELRVVAAELDRAVTSDCGRAPDYAARHELPLLLAINNLITK